MIGIPLPSVALFRVFSLPCMLNFDGYMGEGGRFEYLDRPHVLGQGVREPDGRPEAIFGSRDVGVRAAAHRRSVAEPQPLRPPRYGVGKSYRGCSALDCAIRLEEVVAVVLG